ncbi:MAG: Radical SAM domain heme biosynthesis protein [Candidatus Kapaibacterium sp.]|nr:MAG: Radical SAM domain heme biosynthesis protein [Candidatus Kapabacteria bacterium]
MGLNFSPQNLYRLPWNLADNAISWLEPTYACNLYCDGCYRENRKASHKSLSEIERELDLFASLRKSDSISIAGGDPLVHPQIVEIVRMIRQRGWKPIINTNGQALTKDLLLKLKEAGVWGFTFHIDSYQNRPHWKGKNEIELNELRLHYAKMLAEVGGITCSFNATVYPETIKYVPELVKWAQEHIDIVHIMVFIIYRIATLDGLYDYYIGDKKVTFDDITYAREFETRRTDVKSEEIVAEIRKVYPDFMPCAFLNGTHLPNSYKWLLTGRMGNKHQIFGYVGSKFMELVQTMNHFFTGRYLAYSHPKTQRRGRLYFLLSPFDKGIRQIAKNYFKSFFSNPKAFFNRVYYQSIMIIQPIDILPDGETNMCDGCPDITVWKDRLVWSCRMEEQLKWGQQARVVPKAKELVETKEQKQEVEAK